MYLDVQGNGGVDVDMIYGDFFVQFELVDMDDFYVNRIVML